MQQHPVPQNITSYRFRLIGEMTLGQFARLAIGCLIALLFYALPLPGFIKWSFIFLFACGGALLAFAPVEGRPLEVWIISFFKSIYSPNQYLWRKTVVSLPSLTKTIKKTSAQEPSRTSSKTLSPKEIALMQMLSPKTGFYSEEEIKQAQKLLSLFGQIGTAPEAPEIKPLAKKKAKKEVEFKSELPIPAPPDQPNVLVGMVVSRQGKIVEGAIVEIQDQEGDTVRAMRTNKLGQFRTVSPLGNGEYQITTEKEGCNFDIMKIKLNGEIIPPIEIREKIINTNDQ